jgi:membrane-bound lytic murein transglycosylase MltF
MNRQAFTVVAFVGLVGASAVCGRQTSSSSSSPSASQSPSSSPSPATPTGQAERAEEPLPPSTLETTLPPAVREAVLKDFTGDLDEIIQRRLVRVGVSPSRTFYFVDRGVQRGVAYEYGQLMEERINAKLGNKNVKVHVFFVPMPRTKLVSALVEGKVDMAAGTLTITPERQALVDFTDPTRRHVNQIVVTGPGAAPLKSLEDLSGQPIYVRETSVYETSLIALNEKLNASGKAPVVIEHAPENLEDDDLLEMVNAGLIPAVVVHDFVAKFWKQVFTKLTVHENIATRSDASLGIAVRKNNPKLRAALNNFMGKHGLGSSFGNQVERKYLIDTSYVKGAASEAERQKFLQVVELFRKYSDQYSMDFLLMAAQGYQESRLDQGAQSHVGAVGIMQLMPATGAEMKVGDVKQIEPNIHAGVKYMRSVLEANFKNEPMDPLNKGLFTFAAYNAGPARVRQLRREAARKGLDPNVWFGNVEQVASERIGRETVTYVSNIYKYYVAYRLVLEENQRRAATKQALKAAEGKK